MGYGMDPMAMGMAKGHAARSSLGSAIGHMGVSSVSTK